MTKLILLIDDSRTQLQSFKLLLKRAGHEVITATDAIEGIQATYQNRPDLIISDIMMPNINGYQLCRLLKNDILTKDIPVMLLTILDKKLDKFWGLRAGADAYLLKDLDFEFILKEIAYVLNGTPDLTEEDRANFAKNFNAGNEDVQTRISKILDDSLIESTIVNEFRNLSEFLQDKQKLCKSIFSLLASIIDYNVAGMFFNKLDTKKPCNLNLSISSCTCNENVIENITKEFADTMNGIMGYSCDFDSNIVETSTESQEVITETNKFASKLIIPIMFDNMLIGGICLYNTTAKDYKASKIFNLILNELKMIMRMEWLYSETKHLAITDSLTGLYNRHYLQENIDREYTRAVRYTTSISVAMVDIDHFKRINDTYGHQFGDYVIREISMIINNSLRKTDLVFRYGGEEIIAIMPETNTEKAYVPLERIRKIVSEKEFEYEGVKTNVTISIGIASADQHISTSTQLIELADKALYTAKETGRNKVITI